MGASHKLIGRVNGRGLTIVDAQSRGKYHSSFEARRGMVLAVKPRARSDGLKRCLDLVLAFLLCLAALPLFVIICILIRLDSPGPVTYWRVRMGKDGRCFRCLKFRSMYQNADERLNEVLEADPGLRREYAVFHKLRNDPRVTRAGKILRRLSLDELLQLWNVLKGEMSIVGPRPYDDTDQCSMHGKDNTIHP